MHTSGSLKYREPVPISSIWRLPRQLDVIDAIFERPGDGVVVIFRGHRRCLILSVSHLKLNLLQFVLPLRDI